MGKAGPELVIGSGGSNRIRSAIIQVILNLTKGMDLASAITSPRIHLEGDMLHYEPGCRVPKEKDLPERIQLHRWDGQKFIFWGR